MGWLTELMSERLNLRNRSCVEREGPIRSYCYLKDRVCSKIDAHHDTDNDTDNDNVYTTSFFYDFLRYEVA